MRLVAKSLTCFIFFSYLFSVQLQGQIPSTNPPNDFSFIARASSFGVEAFKHKQNNIWVWVIDLEKGAGLDVGIGLENERDQDGLVLNYENVSISNHFDIFRNSRKEKAKLVLNGSFFECFSDFNDITKNLSCSLSGNRFTNVESPLKKNGDIIALGEIDFTKFQISDRFYQMLNIYDKYASIELISSRNNENLQQELQNLNSKDILIGKYISVSDEETGFFSNSEGITLIGLANNTDGDDERYSKLVVLVTNILINRSVAANYLNSFGVPLDVTGCNGGLERCPSSTKILQLDGGGSSQARGIIKNSLGSLEEFDMVLSNDLFKQYKCPSGFQDGNIAAPCNARLIPHAIGIYSGCDEEITQVEPICIIPASQFNINVNFTGSGGNYSLKALRPIPASPIVIDNASPDVVHTIGPFPNQENITIQVIDNESSCMVFKENISFNCQKNLVVSPTQLSFQAEPTSQSLEITSDIDWSISVDQDWILFNPDNGSNNGMVSINCQSNNSAFSRSGKIIISGEGLSKEVVITQSGTNSLTISPESLNFVAQGEEKNLSIASSNNWEITEQPIWLEISKTSGTNNDIITVSTPANPSVNERNGLITFLNNSGINKTVEVSQSGSTVQLAVNPNELTFLSNNEDIKTFDITTNTNWTLSANQSWIEILSGDNGVENGVVRLSCKENIATDSRNGSITITANNETRTVAITQLGKTTLAVSPVMIDFTADGGNQTFNISTNANWVVGDNQDWIKVANEDRRGTGNKEVTLICDPYEGKVARHALISVSSGNLVKKIDVNQANSTFLETSPSSLGFDPSSGQNRFFIESNTSWSISENISWLELGVTSGSNSTSIVVDYDANSSSTARNGIITITNGIITRTISIYQAGVEAQAGITNPVPDLIISSRSHDLYFEEGEFRDMNIDGWSNTGNVSSIRAYSNGFFEGNVSSPNQGTWSHELEVQAGINDLYINVKCTNGLCPFDGVNTSHRSFTYVRPITSLFFTKSDNTIELRWNKYDQPGTSNFVYRIYRGTTTNPSDAIALNNWSTNSTFLDEEVLVGTTYFYWVRTALSTSGGNPSVFPNPIELKIDAFLNLSKRTDNYDSNGGESSVSIFTNADWTVSSSANWLTSSTQFGNAGNTALNIEVAENNTGITRTGKITFLGGGTSVDYEVTQAASIGIPGNLSGMALPDTTISLVWNKVEGATGYHIFDCKIASNFLFTADTTLIIDGLSPATKYQYKIRAANGADLSDFSNCIELMTVGGNTNTPPMAVNDTISSVQGASLIYNLTENDVDPEGDLLYIELDDTSTEKGVAIALDDSNIFYAPYPNSIGMDTLSYQVCDEDALCAEGKVFITILPNQITECASSCLNVLDIIQMEAATLGEIELNEVQMEAADINDSGNITISDRLELAELIIGRTDTFINSTCFREFQGQNIRIGDLNDCNDPISTTASATLSIGDKIINTSLSTFHVPVNLTSENTNLLGVQFSINWDTSVIEFTNLTKLGNEPSTIVENFVGGLKYLDYSSSTIAKGGLLDLEFKIKKPVSTTINFISSSMPVLAVDDTKEIFQPEMISGNISSFIPVNNERDTTQEDQILNSTINLLANNTGNGNLSIDSIATVINGTASLINNNQSVSFEPNLNFNGEAMVIYSVCDKVNDVCTSQLDTLFIEVQPVNDAPIANNDTLNITNTSGTNFGVISNDLDVDNMLSFDSVKIITLPKQGFLRRGNALFSFTPNSNYVGRDTLIYQICDNGIPSLCDTAMVIINISGSSGGNNGICECREINETDCPTVTLNSMDTILFSSQLQLDTFKGDLTNLSVIISGEDITKIPFKFPKSVNNLTLKDNPILTNLDSLNGINHILGTLSIEGNANLNDLTGLQNIGYLRGNLSIVNNNFLRNVDGLEKIVQCSTLNIRNNSKLFDLTGLSNLECISDELAIVSCPIIANLQNFSNLKSIGRKVYLFGNSGLKSLSGLNDIKTLEELVISGCPALEDLNGLNNLESVGTLFLGYQLKLTNLTGLDNLVSINDLNLFGTTSIESLVGLNNIKTVNGFFLRNNDALKNLVGGEDIINTSILTIINNQQLASLQGLENLIGETINIHIENNNKLKNIDELIGLNRIVNSVSIEKNDSLLNLNGFSNITSIGNTIEIVNNSSLSDCCGIFPLVENLNANLLSNAIGCNSLTEISDSCQQAQTFFQYTQSSNYESSIIHPKSGDPSTHFHFEIDYFDLNNQAPPPGYPKLQLDFEGNGSYSQTNDQHLIMREENPLDTNMVDGKRYIYSRNNLPYSNKWTARVITINTENELIVSDLDTFNVIRQPNLSIFADDIQFSSTRTQPGDAITINATIRNESDFPANDFLVRMTNQFDGVVYKEERISIGAGGSKTISLDTITPLQAGWNPIKVEIDVDREIAETNENDNSAIRPFLNGDVDLAGALQAVASVVPNPITLFPTISLTVRGKAEYQTDLPLEDADLKVSGAEVSFSIEGHSGTYKTITDNNGNFTRTIIFQPPAIGTYTISGTVTDFTVDDRFLTTFNIVPPSTPGEKCVPDLAARISLDTNTIIQGNQVKADFWIENVGCDPAVGATMIIQLPFGDNAVDTITIGNLGVGAKSTTISRTITFNTTGTFSFNTRVIGNENVNECEFRNNTAGASVRVLPPQPDISPRINGRLPNFVYQCNPLGFSFQIHNYGGAPTGVFDAQLIIKKDNQVIDALPTQSVENIPILESRMISYTGITLNEAGNYLFELHADVPTESEGSVSEVREDNNVLSFSLPVLACLPDFSTGGCGGVTISPADPLEVNNITLSTNIRNNGKADYAGAIDISFTINGATYTETLNGLNIGTTKPIEVTIPKPTAFDSEVTVTIDPSNLIEEASEQNNDFTNQLGWDFQPTYACNDRTWSSKHLVNTTIPLIIGLNNYGNYRGNTNLRIEVKAPSNDNFIPIGDQEVTIGRTCACPSVVSRSHTFTEIGKHEVRITIDPNNDYPEFDENNNVLLAEIEISGEPDYQILSQHINPSKLNPAIGEPIDIAVTYENIGIASTEDEMNLKVNVISSQEFPARQVKGLGKNDHFTDTIGTWSGDTDALYIIEAVIDSDNEIDEVRENNNRATRAIIVGDAPNLHFAQFNTSQSTPALGDTIQINFQVGNNGALGCASEVHFSYLKDDGDTIKFASVPVNVAPKDTGIILSVNWEVLDAYTSILGFIDTVNCMDFNLTDNYATIGLNELSVEIIKTRETCPNDSTGKAIATVIGGVAPYQYFWSDGQTDSIVTNLTAGDYAITIYDALSNTASIDFEIATILDTIPPSIICPTDTTIFTCNLELINTPIASDLCGGVTISFSDSISILNDSIITRKWLAIDSSGNQNHCLQTIFLVCDTSNICNDSSQIRLIQESTCDLAEIGRDTQQFTNQHGCDSLIITETILNCNTESCLDSCINILDIVLMKDQVLGRINLEPSNNAAGDINNSGSISTLDVSILGSMLTQGIDTFPFGECSKIFNGETIKVGDVNNCTDDTISNFLELSMENQIIDAEKINEPISVAIIADNFTDIRGFQFSINWDTAALSFENVSSNVAFPSFNLSNTDDGVMNVVWMSDNPVSLADSTTIFNLAFTAKNLITSEISFSETPISQLVVNTEKKISKPITQNATISFDVPQEIEPITLSIDSTAIQERYTFCQPIKTNNFDSIISLDFTLEWDTTVLQYGGVLGLNLPRLTESDFFKMENNLLVNWNGPSTGTSLTTGNTNLFNVCFEVVGEEGTITEIAFKEPIEIGQIHNGNAIILSPITKNGKVSILHNPCEATPEIHHLQETTCNPNQIGIDTFHHINQFNCDSIVYIETILADTCGTDTISNCLITKIGETTTFVHQPTILPITFNATDTQGIAAISITIDLDTAITPLLQDGNQWVHNINPLLTDATSGIRNGKLVFSWIIPFGQIANPIQLNGEVYLFDIHFGGIDTAGNYPIYFDQSVSGNNEYTNGLAEIIHCEQNFVDTGLIIVKGLQMDTLIVPATCDTTNDGSITIGIIGGPIDNYDFYWSTGDTTRMTNSATLGNLNAGTYSVSINTGNDTWELTDLVVSVKDTIAPMILDCPGELLITLNEQCQLIIPQLIIDSFEVADNCTALSDLKLSQSIAAGTIIAGEAIYTPLPISVVFEDAAGNQDSCLVIIRAMNAVEPVLICPSDTVELAVGIDSCEVVLPLFEINLTNNCLATFVFEQTPTAGTLLSVGDHLITQTATDTLTQATYTCTFPIRVKDALAPTLICQTDLLVQIPINDTFYLDLALFSVVGMDNCNDSVSLAFGENIPTYFTCLDIGNQMIPIIAKDEAGNTTICEINLEIVCNEINGKIFYGTTNQEVYGIDVSANLNNAAGDSLIYTKPTNETGFVLKPASNGEYRIDATVNLPHGGINSTDALRVALYFVKIDTTLAEIEILAADVDGKNGVNATDALEILKRFTGQINQFPNDVSDWVSEKPKVVLKDANVTQDIRVSARGDVNSSYPIGDYLAGFAPEATSRNRNVNLINRDFLILEKGNDLVEIPIKVQAATAIGAISLDFEIPAAITAIQEVWIKDYKAAFSLKDGRLRIGWFDLKPLEVEAGETLIKLVAKIDKGSINTTSERLFQLVETSELANGVGGVLTNTTLVMPTILERIDPNFKIAIDPNPAKEVITIQYQQPIEGQLSLRLYNAVGQSVKNWTMENQAAGIYTITHKVADLPAGLYILEGIGKAKEGQRTFGKRQKLIIQK